MMRTMYDVQQLLKKYGTIIYTRDREMDLFLIEEDLRELHRLGLVDTETFQQALLIIQNERMNLA